MGDRAIIGFKANKSSAPVFLYSHWGGSDRYGDVARGIAAARSRWDDPAYATRIAISTIVADAWASELGFGISADISEMTMPDYDDVPVVVWESREVEVHLYGADHSLVDTNHSMAFDIVLAMRPVG